MSTVEVTASLSLPPCENSPLFRLATLLPEIPPRHSLLTTQTVHTASPATLSSHIHAGIADVLPKRHPRSQ
jgi:hypothetical protein